jgi:hypothetical protein
VADVAKTWGKLSPRLQRKKEKSKVALLKVRKIKNIFLLTTYKKGNFYNTFAKVSAVKGHFCQC